jgi:ppGpp synthetase/RelA/SpoT-type nucleotidyltranferase
MPGIFDFETHRDTAIREYSAVRETYVRFCTAVESILQMALKHVAVHQVSTRAKTVESFARKASKPGTDDPTIPKYARPLAQITDLAGGRIIVYVLRDLQTVENAVLQEFVKLEKIDKGAELVAKGLVGYRSIHYIVKLHENRTNLLEYRDYTDLRAELQIRTILQHAWAEMEHDIRFKSEARPDMPLFQRFTALAGLIEVGDREFDQIYELDAKRKQLVRELAQISEEPALSSDVKVEPGAEPVSSDLGPQTPRELIGAHQYSDAIIAYNRLIDLQPTQFSHYLGRAKARFLNGDEIGALSDIAAAEQLRPGHPFIASVRQTIEGRELGEDGTPRSLANQKRTLAEAHDALSAGDGIGAYELYQKAEDLGFSPVLTTVNVAMSKIVEGQPREALDILARLQPFPKSFIELIVTILRGICNLMLDEEQLGAVSDAVSYIYQRMILDGAYFSFSKSVLPILEHGIMRSAAIDEEHRATVEALLNQLRG